MPKKSPFNADASYEEISSQKLTKERAVREIINTSASDGLMSLKREDDPIVIAECIKREEAGVNRTSLLKPLKAKLKKLQPQTALDIKVDEIKSPDIWQPARDYLSAAQRFARASVACQVMLGFQLTEIKKNLGFTQGRKAKDAKRKTAESAVFNTWAEHVSAELGLADRTARVYMTMADAAKSRLKSCFKNLPLLDQPVTNYSDEQLQILEKAVNKITDGQTQTEFLISCGIAKKPQGSSAKGGNLKGDDEEKVEPTMRQLSFALFSDPVHSLSQLRANTDYEKALLALPTEQTEEEPVSLISIKSELEAMLADVEAAIKSNREAT